MITFLISLVALIVGYHVYGRIVERIFGPDDRETPAVRINDGVDFVVLPSWKIFMIQFLNIAGTGPIFGAIMGVKFGPAAYLWIVFGCIFGGAVHDFLSGMLSIRHNGASYTELVGKYLGRRTERILLVFSILVLLMVGAVFVYSPAMILGNMCGGSETAFMIWVAVIFIYYILATMLPIDKIIGRIYPLFAFALLFMAVSLALVLFLKWPSLPEVWDIGTTQNLTGQALVPCLFITIACGAVSGFHATQSPLMARCMKSERSGRPIFYGAMITEGIVALIWATIGSWFFYDGGYSTVGGTMTTAAPRVVSLVANGWLGVAGGILALLGVVAAPITSGDTAFRSARLIIADFLHFSQHSLRNRFIIAVPMFVVAALLLWYNVADEDGFNVVWGYFGWCNQTLSCFTLWTITVYLALNRKPYVITLVPALFMTTVCVTFFCISKNGFAMPAPVAYAIGGAVLVVSLIWFVTWLTKTRRTTTKLSD